MKTVVFLDLDGTLWEKQPWGGIISRANVKELRDLSHDARLVLNTGRPQGQVETSFLRAGNDGNTLPWQHLYVDDTRLPLRTFSAGIFEDGLIVKLREDDGFKTVFNSLDVATPEYRRLCDRLFDDDAKGFYRANGIELVTEGVVTEEKSGFVIRDAVRGRYIRPLATTLSPLYRQCNETTKLTYKPPLGPPMSAMKIDYDHLLWKAVEAYLGELEPKWREEVGVDLPPDAIDLYPLKLEGHPTGERYRKAEANAMALREWPLTESVVYVGDGYNDARAMMELERNFPGKMLFVAPYKSDPKVVAFIAGPHRDGVTAHHLSKGYSIDNTMEPVVDMMEDLGML